MRINYHKSRIQLAMGAVDAVPVGPSHSPLDTQALPEPSVQPSATVDELLEGELNMDSSSQLEWEEEKEIEIAVQRLKTLSCEVEQSHNSKHQRKMTPRKDYFHVDATKPVEAKESELDLASLQEIHGAPFDRLLQVAPLLALMILGGALSGMHATSQWWRQAEPLVTANQQRIVASNDRSDWNVTKKIVEAKQTIAPRLPLIDPELPVAKPQARVLIASLKRQQTNFAPDTTQVSKSEMEPKLSLQQRLDAWESDTSVPLPTQGFVEPTTLIGPHEAVRTPVKKKAAIPRDVTVPTPIVDLGPIARVQEESPRDPPQSEPSEVKPTPVQNFPRPPLEVELALNSSLGLDQLSSSERERLKQQLVKGACTATALSAFFERVPVLAIRDLRSSLSDDC